MNIVQEQAEKVLQHFTKDEHYEVLKNAKESYIKQTGKIDEETDEYESRMNCFNDWYILNYKKTDGTSILDSAVAAGFDSELVEALKDVNYSLFHFSKINFRKQIIIKDVLHGTKFVLSPKNGMLPLVEDDLFVGRSVKYQDEYYLLNGICILPREILSTLKKETKKIRKLNNGHEEEAFLLNLERLKTRSIQYGHVELSKIFSF